MILTGCSLLCFLVGASLGMLAHFLLFFFANQSVSTIAHDLGLLLLLHLFLNISRVLGFASVAVIASTS